MTKGVPPQAGSGHSPKGGAASSTASPAQPSVPNAVIERMQELSFSLAMGGSEETDPAKLLDRIEEGVELIQRVETIRAAEIVEELSKLPASWGTEGITWGKVKAAILARCAVDPVRYQNGEYGITNEQLFPNGSKP